LAKVNRATFATISCISSFEHPADFTFWTLRQINSQMNPFRFIIYSEWSGKALAPVSPQ